MSARAGCRRGCRRRGRRGGRGPLLLGEVAGFVAHCEADKSGLFMALIDHRHEAHRAIAAARVALGDLGIATEVLEGCRPAAVARRRDAKAAAFSTAIKLA